MSYQKVIFLLFTAILLNTCKSQPVINEIIEEPKPEPTPQGHTGAVYSVAFSPDGSMFASGAHDTTIKLWDAKTGREIKTFKGHTWWVYSVAFSPDGTQALTGRKLFLQVLLITLSNFGM